MILYKTVGKAAQAEQIIEKSRFITHVRPVASREEADSFFAEIKKEYKASLNILTDVLDEIVTFFKDEKITYEKVVNFYLEFRFYKKN